MYESTFLAETLMTKKDRERYSDPWDPLCECILGTKEGPKLRWGQSCLENLQTVRNIVEESNDSRSQRDQQEWRPAGKPLPSMSTYRSPVFSPTCGHALGFWFHIFCKTMCYGLGHKSAMLLDGSRTYRKWYLMQECWSFIKGVALAEF